MDALIITAPQLKRLQILYSQFERHSLDCPGIVRESRLAWASSQTGRTIDSFKQLTLVEGKRLIDMLQGQLGVKAANKSPRRRMTRKQGEKLGTEGRRDQIHDEVTLAGPREAAMIQADLTRLGWDQARLEAFLRSTRGPLKGITTVRTLGQANKLHWALKRLTPKHERIAS